MGSVGDWVECSAESVKDTIYGKAGNPDLSGVEEASDALRKKVNLERYSVVSILSSLDETDSFLEKSKEDAEKLKIFNSSEICQAQLPQGTLMSRDSNAVTAGLKVAPHQQVIAEIAALEMPALVAVDLSEIARKSGSHLARKARSELRTDRIGTNVFIGHGRSLLWRELKDFVVDRLRLPYEEFNRVPVAGVTNIARLSEMLDGAACALVLLTAEDEQVDGSMRARMNVIHEVGLFQGRLGFTKAIVVLEEGCEEFSNIQGLGQIRFPRGNVSAAFEEIRAVLEREGLI